MTRFAGNLDELTPLLTAAGQAALKYFRQPLSVSNKATGGHFDPVTEADREAEHIIRDGLAKSFPDHRIVGEEFGGELGDGLTWVIDPIDGTRSFMSGMLHWGILLGLYDGVEPVFGAMHQPFTGEFFFGDNAQAEYWRDGAKRALRVRPCASLEQVTLASTGPEFLAPPELAAFSRLQAKCRQVRFGGDCYLYALVAMGQLDLGVEAGLNAYDIAALIPIVRGAGGIVTDWQGNSAALGGRVIAAGDARAHALALEVLQAGLSDAEEPGAG